MAKVQPNDYIDNRFDITEVGKLRARRVALGVCAQCGVRPLYSSRRCYHCSRQKRELDRVQRGAATRNLKRRGYTQLKNKTIICRHPDSGSASSAVETGPTQKPESASQVGDHRYRRFIPHPRPDGDGQTPR